MTLDPRHEAAIASEVGDCAAPGALGEAREFVSRVAADPRTKALTDEFIAGSAPARHDAGVWINPARMGGDPCVNGTRVPVEMVVGLATEPGGVNLARDTWDLTRGQVLVACWYVAVHGSRKQRKRWGPWAEAWDSQFWHSDYDAIPDPTPDPEARP